MMYREVYCRPSSSVSSQLLLALWKRADWIRVLNWMSFFRSNFLVKYWMYLSVSGWGEKCSVQSHSSSSSCENEKM